jgi:arginine repressor
MRSTPKALRHHRILELVSSEPMVTQEEMVRRLTRQGLKVTQATLSRDIKELGLVKSADGYAAPGTIADAVPTPSLSHLLREFVVDVREAQTLLVLTGSGAGQVLSVEDELRRQAVPLGDRVVFTGRMHPQKNLPLLLEAWTQVARQTPANLILIGPGEDREALSGMAERSGIIDRVQFAGAVSDPAAA